MTADCSKNSSHYCLICSSKAAGVSTRNSVKIFNHTYESSEKQPLVETIRYILDTKIDEDNVHSSIVCKKCYKLFTEFSELEARMMEIREEIVQNYTETVRKINSTLEPPECITNDHDYIDSMDYELVDEAPLQQEQILKQESIEEHLEEYLPEEFCHEAAAAVAAAAAAAEEEYLDVQILEKIENGETEEEIPKMVVILEQQQEEEEEVEEEEEEEEKKRKKPKIIKTKDDLEPIVSRQQDLETYKCLVCCCLDPVSSSRDDEKTTVILDAKEIVNHMKSVHDLRLYICDVCGQDFRKRNEISQHMDDHIAKEEGDFQCEVCNRIFNNLRLFRIHKRIHYPQAKSWTCETCNKRYSSKNLLDEHVNTHLGRRPHLCATCGKDFASKYTYKNHIKTHEVRERPFQCSQCSKTFLSQQNLNQHEKTHLGIKEFVCQECGKAFGSPNNLEVHSIVHTGYKPFICKVCGKAFARKAEIRDHERTHTGEKPYQCEFCGATFSQRSNLQSHKRATHYNDKRYKCDDCGKGFKRRRLLDYHIKAAHTGERPHKCEICGATFVYPEHYKKHMRIHTGEKPYLCEVCGKAFNSRDNRNAHRFIHSDKKPYECAVCSMGFMRKPLLYAHMQTAGHLDDNIIINQPRLTTEEDEEEEEEEEKIIAIPEEGVHLLMEDEESNQLTTDLYVTELKDHHVIIQQDGQDIYEQTNVLDTPISFVESEFVECKSENITTTAVYTYDDDDDENPEEMVLPTSGNFMGDGKNHQVRFVQIRLPSASGTDGKSWQNLVQQHG